MADKKIPKPEARPTADRDERQPYQANLAEILSFLDEMIGMNRTPSSDISIDTLGEPNPYPFSNGTGNDIGDWVDMQTEGGPSAHLIFDQVFGGGTEGPLKRPERKRGK